MARGSPEVRIRRLRAGDHAGVVDLLGLVGMNPHVRGRESPEAFRRQLRSSRTTYLGAFDGERLVGIVLGTHDSRKGWINRLAVYPEYQRRGIGTRLVRACERGLRAAGMEIFSALIEPGNEASETFFEGLGYEVWQLTYARKKLRRGV